MNTQESATPFPRPDHKAKRHPKPTTHYRKVVRRQCEIAIGLALGLEVGDE